MAKTATAVYRTAVALASSKSRTLILIPSQCAISGSPSPFILFTRLLHTSPRSLQINSRRRRKDRELLRSTSVDTTTTNPKHSIFSSSPPAPYPNSPEKRYPAYDRLLPCPMDSGPPRVEHLVVFEEENVVTFISNSLDLPHLYIRDLILFGAVHYALVCPKPPPTATDEQLRIYEEVTEPSVLQKRSSIKGKTVREAQKTFRVTDPSQLLEAGTYLRVHVHPKRFPRCYEVDWKSRIIAVTESYVVLNKPTAVSVGGTTDNIEECCTTFTARALGLKTPLITTHQIDNCTEGCVVLSRTTEFCSYFHQLIREKKTKKVYLALAAAPVKTGILSHFMRPVNIAPRLVSQDSITGWHLCQLEVLECNAVPWPHHQMKLNNIKDALWPSQDVAYECKINLLTGKTHQVRAQFAAVGAPLLGDSMYMPAAMAELTNPGVNPFKQDRNKFASENEKMVSMDAWIACHGKEPSAGIGLQASHISWDEGKCAYEAGSPWWQC